MSRKLINFKREESYNRKPYKVNEAYDKTIKPLFYDELLLKAKTILKSKGLRGLIITEYDYKVIGYISRIKLIKIAPNCSTMLVKDVIEKISMTAREEDELKDIAEEMIKKNIDCVPVLDEKNGMKYKGIITLENILNVLSKINNDLLYNKIKDKIDVKKIYCRNSDTLAYAWKKMIDNSLTGILVLDEEDNLIGILTQHDVLSVKIPNIHIVLDDSNSSIPVSSVMMTKNLVKMTKNNLIIDVIKIMLKHKIGRLPIVDENNPNKALGMIDKQTLIQYLINLL